MTTPVDPTTPSTSPATSSPASRLLHRDVRLVMRLLDLADHLGPVESLTMLMVEHRALFEHQSIEPSVIALLFKGAVSALSDDGQRLYLLARSADVRAWFVSTLINQRGRDFIHEATTSRPGELTVVSWVGKQIQPTRFFLDKLREYALPLLMAPALQPLDATASTKGEV